VTVHVIPQDSLKTIRQLVDEMERVKLTGRALHDLLLKELFIQTGVDMHYQDCDLDVERGILTCKDGTNEQPTNPEQ
jgi:hypothetical protein